MKTTLALLALTTALGSGLVFSFSDTARASVVAMITAQGDDDGLVATVRESVIRMADNDDDHDEGDDDDDDDCGDDDDDTGAACGLRLNSAPAGSVAPPSNGLFGTGAGAPKVQMN